MNSVSETNYQWLHAVNSLVNEYSVLVPSVNFDQVIHLKSGCFFSHNV